MHIRCLIVDDNPAFLDSATRLLTSDGIEIVGTASNGAEAIALAATKRPDVVLVDVELGEESGIELAGALAPLPVVLISTYPEADVADLVEVSVAVGFVPKSALSAEAVRALLG